MTDDELDAIEARANVAVAGYLLTSMNGDAQRLITELRSARKRLAAIEALAEKWLKEAVDRNDECSPTIAAFTHDIQRAVRGDD